ncbi:MAG: hypothetical protein LBF72_01815 [Holosporales bacterium]|jgi:hypothetical protein|nr:hypothetical protein [Holosporales bacterium]
MPKFGFKHFLAPLFLCGFFSEAAMVTEDVRFSATATVPEGQGNAWREILRTNPAIRLNINEERQVEPQETNKQRDRRKIIKYVVCSVVGVGLCAAVTWLAWKNRAQIGNAASKARTGVNDYIVRTFNYTSAKYNDVKQYLNRKFSAGEPSTTAGEPSTTAGETSSAGGTRTSTESPASASESYASTDTTSVETASASESYATAEKSYAATEEPSATAEMSPNISEETTLTA